MCYLDTLPAYLFTLLSYLITLPNNIAYLNSLTRVWSKVKYSALCYETLTGTQVIMPLFAKKPLVFEKALVLCALRAVLTSG